jgi:hypothetical protein
VGAGVEESLGGCGRVVAALDEEPGHRRGDTELPREIVPFIPIVRPHPPPQATSQMPRPPLFSPLYQHSNSGNFAGLPWDRGAGRSLGHARARTSRLASTLGSAPVAATPVRHPILRECRESHSR